MPQPCHPILCLLLTATFLAGCATPPTTPASVPSTFYDSVVTGAGTDRPLSIPELADRLASADVVVIGEFHGHQGSHLLQARLQAALYERNPNQVLALEAFNIDNQLPLDRYLTGELGEEELMADATAWENYQGSYRPLVEFARRHELPVVAANAPAGVVRCVGRQGAGYVDGLPATSRQQLPEQPFPEVAGYRERFMRTMGANRHGQDSAEGRRRLENTYQAQLLRDSTMADQILKALETHPNHQVIMITGTFHSENRQGLVAVLEQRAPQLAIRVLTPNMVPADAPPDPVSGLTPGDYRYDLWPVPAAYQDAERERAAMMARFGRARELDCQ